ncbi:hypothetical protein D3C87_1520850 [compost metagenome]
MLHDRAEDGGLQVLPFGIRLGNGDEIVAEINARDAGNVKKAQGQRRGCSFCFIAKLGRAFFHDNLAGKKLQGRRVRRGFGLDEHGLAPGRERHSV